MVMESLRLRACAKVNLAIDVVRRRPDGYHDVRMIMQMLDLCDFVTLRRMEEAGIRLSCDHPDLPCDDGNIAYRAAALMMERFDLQGGVRIEIEKHIPLAAGMAGGSTDCAAVLQGMNALFQLGLDLKQLMDIGVTLGADVPFCLMQGTALSEGIGEILSPLPSMPDLPVLIAKPPIGVSTKYVYEHLRLDEQIIHPDIDGMVRALQDGDLAGITERLGNVLETVTIPEHPEIAEIKKIMEDHGAAGALMSGSGPTVFGIFTGKEEAEKAMEDILNKGIAQDVCITRPV